jgi:hypothetical protein
VPVDDVSSRVLHPALAQEWDRLRELLRDVRTIDGRRVS